MNKRLAKKRIIIIISIIIIMALLFLYIFIKTSDKNQHNNVSMDDISKIIYDELYGLKQDNYAFPNIIDLNNIDLNNIDLYKVSIGSPIHTYEYTSKGRVKELDANLYPIIYNNNLIALACFQNSHCSQIDFEGLVKDIASKLDMTDKFAILYDKEYCYICTPINLIALFNSNSQYSNRGDINTSKYKTIVNKIILNNYSPIQSLDNNYK